VTRFCTIIEPVRGGNRRVRRVCPVHFVRRSARGVEPGHPRVHKLFVFLPLRFFLVSRCWVVFTCPTVPCLGCRRHSSSNNSSGGGSSSSSHHNHNSSCRSYAPPSLETEGQNKSRVSAVGSRQSPTATSTPYHCLERTNEVWSERTDGRTDRRTDHRWNERTDDQSLERTTRATDTNDTDTTQPRLPTPTQPRLPTPTPPTPPTTTPTPTNNANNKHYCFHSFTTPTPTPTTTPSTTTPLLLC